MGVRGFCHFPEAEIQSFRKQDVQQADPVGARGSGSQMGEGVGEADRFIDLQQDVCNPDGRHPAIEIENQLLCVFGNVRGEPVDPQRSILDAAMGNGPVARGTRQPVKTVRKTGFAIYQPGLRIERNCQAGVCLRRGQRHKNLLEITVSAGMIKPYVSRSESIAKMKEDRNLP